MVTYGVFFNSLVSEFGWSRAAISGASSLAFFLSGVGAILIGRLSDQYGPRIVMRVAALFFAAGLILTSQCASLWQLYLFYGLLFGLGLGSVDVIALSTTARWFQASRGKMMAMVKVGTGVGQFSVPLIATALIVVYGWRQAYLAIGLSVLVLFLGVAQLLSNPADATPVEGEERCGLTASAPAGAGQALRSKQFWLIGGSYGVLVFCLLTVLVHIVPHGRDMGFSQAVAAGALSTIGAVSILGRLLTGLAIDRFTSRWAMIACFMVLISSLLWLQVADSLWMLYLFSAVYGMAHGGFFTAIPTLIAEVFGIKAHGSIFGIVVFFGAVGGSIGPLIAGKLFDFSGSYSYAFQMITATAVLGLVLMLLVTPLEN